MNYQTKRLLVGILLILIGILLVIFSPLAILWSLNTLFPILAIPYNFYTWLSVIVLNLTWMYKPNFNKG